MENSPGSKSGPLPSRHSIWLDFAFFEVWQWSLHMSTCILVCSFSWVFMDLITFSPSFHFVLLIDCICLQYTQGAVNSNFYIITFFYWKVIYTHFLNFGKYWKRKRQFKLSIIQLPRGSQNDYLIYFLVFFFLYKCSKAFLNSCTGHTYNFISFFYFTLYAISIFLQNIHKHHFLMTTKYSVLWICLTVPRLLVIWVISSLWNAVLLKLSKNKKQIKLSTLAWIKHQGRRNEYKKSAGGKQLRG